MRHERFWIYTSFLLALSCSRETPAPPATATQPAAAAPAPQESPATTSATPPATPTPRTGTYAEAMLWFGSAPAFHFVVAEGGVQAEGNLKRPTIGKESIRFRAKGEEWRATTGQKGVTWERLEGKAWIAEPSPSWGNRLFQRVTVVFDPQKKEGAPQMIDTESTANHYRFTNANTGEVHDVWVNTKDNHVERMTIGESMTMELKIRN